MRERSRTGCQGREEEQKGGAAEARSFLAALTLALELLKYAWERKEYRRSFSLSLSSPTFSPNSHRRRALQFPHPTLRDLIPAINRQLHFQLSLPLRNLVPAQPFILSGQTDARPPGERLETLECASKSSFG